MTYVNSILLAIFLLVLISLLSLYRGRVREFPPEYSRPDWIIRAKHFPFLTPLPGTSDMYSSFRIREGSITVLDPRGRWAETGVVLPHGEYIGIIGFDGDLLFYRTGELDKISIRWENPHGYVYTVNEKGDIFVRIPYSEAKCVRYHATEEGVVGLDSRQSHITKECLFYVSGCDRRAIFDVFDNRIADVNNGCSYSIIFKDGEIKKVVEKKEECMAMEVMVDDEVIDAIEIPENQGTAVLRFPRDKMREKKSEISKL